MPLAGYNSLTDRRASAPVDSHETQLAADFAGTHKTAGWQPYGLLAIGLQRLFR